MPLPQFFLHMSESQPCIIRNTVIPEDAHCLDGAMRRFSQESVISRVNCPCHYTCA